MIRSSESQKEGEYLAYGSNLGMICIFVIYFLWTNDITRHTSKTIIQF